MPYGGIDFEQVWRYQIGCMMSNQYSALIQAIHKNSADDVIIACLRLGWNDAFKHVSENTASFNMMSDAIKNDTVNRACKELLPYFKEYAQKTDSKGRYDTIVSWFGTPTLDPVFSPIKEVYSAKYRLCLGHIQKLFNITMKLLLCLIVSAEHAKVIGINVKLGDIEGADVCLVDHGLLSSSQFPYAFNTADCPVDHFILEKINVKKTSAPAIIYGRGQFRKIVWSKMGDKAKGAGEDQRNYLSAQQEIENIQRGTGKCNLYFDFENWK